VIFRRVRDEEMRTGSERRREGDPGEGPGKGKKRDKGVVTQS